MKLRRLVVLALICVGFVVGCGKSDKPGKAKEEPKVVEDMNIQKDTD
ncbi:MAG: hypothetical protein AB8B55_06075 [Mariniblastus sp.]